MDQSRAIDLLEQCARQLQRTGGMLNKDLAREVTKYTAALSAKAPLPQPAMSGSAIERTEG